MVIFKMPYLECMRDVGPFIVVMFIVIVIVVLSPDIALFIPN